MVFIVIRCVILYFTVTVAMRIMGKRQLGELQPCELVITLLISELASIPIQDTQMPILYGIIPILTLATLEIAVSFLALKFARFRRILYGTAVTIVRDGKINETEMERARVSIDDLIESMRAQGIADIRNVGYAILETNGNMSIIETAEGDMPEVLLSDGYTDKKVLKRLKITENQMLKGVKAQSPKELFFVSRDKNGKYFCIKRGKK